MAEKPPHTIAAGPHIWATGVIVIDGQPHARVRRSAANRANAVLAPKQFFELRVTQPMTAIRRRRSLVAVRIGPHPLQRSLDGASLAHVIEAVFRIRQSPEMAQRL